MPKPPAPRYPEASSRRRAAVRRHLIRWSAIGCLGFAAAFPPGASDAAYRGQPLVPVAENGQPVFSTYKDQRFGASISYPSHIFVQSRNDSGDGSVTFLSQDGRAFFQVAGSTNTPRRTADQLAADTESALRKERAAITYRREDNNWFVFSGFMADMIFYQKTILSHNESIINAFRIIYPKQDKQYFDEIVSRMSWSFKADPVYCFFCPGTP